MATDQQLDIRVHGAQQTQSPIHGGTIPPHGGVGGAGIGPTHGANGPVGPPPPVIPSYSEDFNSYADGTKLAAAYNNALTPTSGPSVPGWRAMGLVFQGDGAGNGDAGSLQIVGGKIVQAYRVNASDNAAVVYDFGSSSGIWDFKLAYGAFDGTVKYHALLFSANSVANAKVTGIKVQIYAGFSHFFGANANNGALNITGSNINYAPADGDVFRVKIDRTLSPPKIFFFINGVAAGNAAGYDISGVTDPLTTFAGVSTGSGANQPVAGDVLYDSISYTPLP